MTFCLVPWYVFSVTESSTFYLNVNKMSLDVKCLFFCLFNVLACYPIWTLFSFNEVNRILFVWTNFCYKTETVSSLYKNAWICLVFWQGRDNFLYLNVLKALFITFKMRNGRMVKTYLPTSSTCNFRNSWKTLFWICFGTILWFCLQTN